METSLTSQSLALVLKIKPEQPWENSRTWYPHTIRLATETTL